MLGRSPVDVQGVGYLFHQLAISGIPYDELVTMSSDDMLSRRSIADLSRVFRVIFKVSNKGTRDQAAKSDIRVNIRRTYHFIFF